MMRLNSRRKGAGLRNPGDRLDSLDRYSSRLKSGGARSQHSVDAVDRSCYGNAEFAGVVHQSQISLAGGRSAKSDRFIQAVILRVSALFPTIFRVPPARALRYVVSPIQMSAKVFTVEVK